MASQKRQIKFAIIGVLGALILVYVVAGASPDRSFALSKIRGLDRAEILRRFGKPDYEGPDDSQGFEAQGKIDSNGNFHLRYHSDLSWQGFSYLIFFEKGHVVRVAVGHK